MCSLESILHRDLKLQSNNKCDSDDSDDASDNDNPLDDSDSQSLPPQTSAESNKGFNSNKTWSALCGYESKSFGNFWVKLVFEIFE